MKIYLVRHGQAAAKWHQSDDPGLSALGHRQAAIVARELGAQLDPEAQLISSPLLRARETAHPLARTLGTSVTIVDAFREIPTPVPLEERQAWLKSIALQNWSEQHTLVRQWYRSVQQQLQKIRHPAVVFTHFMVLNAIVGALSAEDKIISFLPDNASITTLQLNHRTFRVLKLGSQLKTVIH